MDNTQMAEKRAWTKSQLVVLVRSKPEEAVLSGRKYFFSSASSGSDDSGCGQPVAVCTICYSVQSS